MALQLRMTLYGGLGLPPFGALFPADAGPYTPALWVFPLQPDQALPRSEPGSLVEIDGPLEKRARPKIVAGDITVVPASGGLQSDDGHRIFAERGDVLGHPAVIGWETSWRFTPAHSTDPVDTWRRRLRRAKITGAIGWLAVGAMIALIAVSWIFGDSDGLDVHFFFIGQAGAGSVGVRAHFAYRRARRAIREASAARAGQGRPMWMRLDYTAGHGLGPSAVAALFEHADDPEPVSYVSVGNVPEGFDPVTPLPVTVGGDPLQHPLIVGDGFELWPLERAHRDPHSQQRRLRQRR